MNPETFHLLREAARDGLRVRIAGDCMAPMLEDGRLIEAARRRLYWPGDIIVIRRPDGRWLAHRLIGVYPKGWRLQWLTQADAAPRPDASVAATEIVGKVIDGNGAAQRLPVPLRTRLWALGRFLRFVGVRLVGGPGAG